jgi:molybdenum-dependent oxidoreductase-like protein
VPGSNELTTLPSGNGDLPLRGAAWDSDVRIARVDISINFGQSWQQTGITAPNQPLRFGLRGTHTVKLFIVLGGAALVSEGQYRRAKT